jgi:erythromycin esterase
MRFTHFAIEASFPERWQWIGTSRLAGNPGPREGHVLLDVSTEEVVDLVRWMRDWNASGGQPRVHFVGIDMQFPGAAIDSVVSFVGRLDPNDATDVVAKYSCLNVYRNTPTRVSPLNAQYLALGQEAKDACRTALMSVEVLLSDRAPRWRGTVGEETMGLVQRLARVVTQWEGAARVSSPASVYARDEAMAENAAWWMEAAPASRA